MAKSARFTVSFNMALDNAGRAAMAALYAEAFGARKTYEGTPPDNDDLHIMLDICGTGVLIAPGAAVGKGLKDPLVCEVRFTDEGAFNRAYEILKRDSKSCSLEGPYPWATKLALLEDTFGVGWALYYNAEND